jgi:hypothetical protein
MTDVLALAVGEECPRCQGTLVRERYKGTAAAVCTDCAIPAVRLF